MKNRLSVTDILMILGLIIAFFGGACAESENIIYPIVIISIGMALMGVPAVISLCVKRFQQ